MIREGFETEMDQPTSDRLGEVVGERRGADS